MEFFLKIYKIKTIYFGFWLLYYLVEFEVNKIGQYSHFILKFNCFLSDNFYFNHEKVLL